MLLSILRSLMLEVRLVLLEQGVIRVRLPAVPFPPAPLDHDDVDESGERDGCAERGKATEVKPPPRHGRQREERA